MHYIPLGFSYKTVIVNDYLKGFLPGELAPLYNLQRNCAAGRVWFLSSLYPELDNFAQRLS